MPIDAPSMAADALAEKYGWGTLSSTQKKNLNLALEEAGAAGIDQELFIRILWQEGRFQDDPGGNGGGIGQFTASTARGYGYSQEQLRNNPALAIKMAARLFADNKAALGGDDSMAAAAYFVGSDIVAKGAQRNPGNWLQGADDEFKARYPDEYAHQGGVSNYMSLIGRGPVGDRYGGGTGGTTTPSAKHPTGTAGDLPDYNADVYWEQDENGDWIHNDAQYYQDYNIALQNQQLKQQLETGPLALYMEQTMRELSAKIEAGQLDATKASTVLNTRLNSYKTAMDVLSSESYGFGTKVGDPYAAGRGPSDYATTRLKLPTKSNAGNPVVDPLAEAMAAYKDAETRMGAIQTPTVPSLAPMLNSQLPAGTSQGPGAVYGPPSPGPGATVSAPPPPPPPAPSADLNASTVAPPTDPAALAAWYEKQKQMGY